jgi:Flp pilus assembly protein TadG
MINSLSPARSHQPAPWTKDTRDRGSATVELVIAVPALLLMVLTVVQFAVAAHARHVAQAVAAHAVDTTRRQGGTSAAGHRAGDALLAQLGPTLTAASIDVHRGPDRATATVTGYAETVVPGLRLRIRATSSGPVERLVAPAPDRGGSG